VANDLPITDGLPIVHDAETMSVAEFRADFLPDDALPPLPSSKVLISRGSTPAAADLRSQLNETPVLRLVPSGVADVLFENNWLGPRAADGHHSRAGDSWSDAAVDDLVDVLSADGSADVDLLKSA
jgi:hypothetical protein